MKEAITVKMETAKVRFLTFDAGDVIATSGYYYMTPTGLTDFSELSYGGSIVTTGNELITPHAYGQTLLGYRFTEGQYYHLVEGGSNNRVSNAKVHIDVEEIAGAPKDGIELKSFAEIVDWVTKFGAAQ